MKEYSEEALDKLCEAVQNDEGLESWFTENGCEELWVFWNALEGDEKSFRWLMSHHHPELAAVIDSIGGNSQATRWLIVNNYRELAAFTDAIEGSQKAISFLLQMKETGWVRLAQAIYTKNNKRSKNIFRTIFNFGNPYGR